MAYAIDYGRTAGRATTDGWFARLRRALEQSRRYRAVYAELDAMTDRELADLGFARSDVRDVARQAAYLP
jgi:uncharacterized protein YjiS (DUF1127 family)